MSRLAWASSEAHELLGGRHAASGTSNGIFLVDLLTFQGSVCLLALVDLSDLSILSLSKVGRANLRRMDLKRRLVLGPAVY